MAIAKTKLKLIEVARQLFARNGVENTTMNDIAEASKKGRRTLYTYFNSKHDIYSAVVETELQNLLVQLEEVTKKNIPANDKLILFIFTRLNAIKNVVVRNGTLRADFFRNIWRVENVRKEFDQKEISYLQRIMEEGARTAIFEIADIPQTARILHYALKGLEVPTIRGVLGLNINSREDRELIESIIFKGIYRK